MSLRELMYGRPENYMSACIYQRSIVVKFSSGADQLLLDMFCTRNIVIVPFRRLMIPALLLQERTFVLDGLSYGRWVVYQSHDNNQYFIRCGVIERKPVSVGDVLLDSNARLGESFMPGDMQRDMADAFLLSI